MTLIALGLASTDGQIGSLVSEATPLAHAKNSPYLLKRKSARTERIAREQASHAEPK